MIDQTVAGAFDVNPGRGVLMATPRGARDPLFLAMGIPTQVDLSNQPECTGYAAGFWEGFHKGAFPDLRVEPISSGLMKGRTGCVASGLATFGGRKAALHAFVVDDSGQHIAVSCLFSVDDEAAALRCKDLVHAVHVAR
jgi:hypothetical protein